MKKTQKKAKVNPAVTQIRKQRTLCQIQKDFKALNDFFDQMMISAEAFDLRKQALLDELEGGQRAVTSDLRKIRGK